jgi:hypothetical protein
MATSDLGNFLADLKTVGIPTGSHYVIELPPIPGFNTGTLNMYCQAVNLPDLSIMDVEARIFGEASHIPFGIAYSPLQLTFLVTNKFDICAYFEKWSNMVFDRRSRTSGYYKDYVKEIVLSVQDKEGNTRYKVRFMQCWPKNLQPTSLAHDNHTPIMLNVTLQYKWWEKIGEPRDIASEVYEAGFGQEQQGYITGNANGVLVGAGLTLGPGGLNFSSALPGLNISRAGPLIGSNILGGTNLVRDALGAQNIPMPGDSNSSFSQTLSGYMSQLGSSSSVLGINVGAIGNSLSNVLAPVGAITQGVVGIGGALSSINNLLGRVGIQTNLGTTINSLYNVAGNLSVLNQANGVPGAISTIGASLGGLSGSFETISKSIGSIPGTTKSVSSSISNLGTIFGVEGSNLTAVANLIP